MSEKQILTEIKGVIIYRNFVKNLPYNPILIKRTRENRKAGILSEVLFWKMVRDRSFHHIDFDRQRIVGHYIVDFYVKALGLVVEIVGKNHQNNEECDDTRILFLQSFGLQVFVIQDIDIKRNPAHVMQDLEDFIIMNFS